VRGGVLKMSSGSALFLIERQNICLILLIKRESIKRFSSMDKKPNKQHENYSFGKNMHNDIGRCGGVIMVARWESEVGKKI
jgi:hypothetical protein